MTEQEDRLVRRVFYGMAVIALIVAAFAVWLARMLP